MKLVKSFLVGMMVLGFFNVEAFANIANEMDTVVVTASRINQKNYKIAGNVTVITREDIEASNAQNVPDVLSNALGVFTYDNNTIKTTSVDIRGFGDTAKSNVLVMVNGRKINAVDLSGSDLVQIPIGAVERIEIMRGAGSVLYGDNAVGGVINIITKKGEGKLSGNLSAVYGSYDTQGTDIELSGAYKGVSYFLHADYLDQRGYRQNSDVLLKDFNTRLGYQLTDKVSIDLDIGHHEDTYDLPGGLDEAELVSLSRRGSANMADMAHTEDSYVKLSFDVEPWPEDMDLGYFVVDLHYRDRDVFDSYVGWDTDRSIETKGITAKYIFDRTIFDKEVNFITGIDYYDTENDIVGKGSNADDLTISKDEFGVYGFAEYEVLDNLFFNGGTRYHKADYAFSQRNVAVDVKTQPDEWVSMGGLKYEYAKGSNLHFNAQQTFRFLLTDEWYSSWSGTLNTGLKQQTGTQYEMGVKHNFDNKVVVNVTPYWIINKNEIFYDAGSYSNTNYDKTQRAGVEVGTKVDLEEFFDVKFLDKFEFFSNYTYQKPLFTDGANDGQDVPMAPRHQASSGLITQFFKKYNVSLMGRYVGSRYLINDTLNEMPKAKPYYVLDAKMAYKRDDFEFYVAVNNLLNSLYSPYQIKKTATTRDHYPAAEQNYTMGMKVKF